MSYGRWWVEFTASDMKGKLSDVVFDMEAQGEPSDYFWFTIKEETIEVEHSSDEFYHNSDEMLETVLHRLWAAHGATISGKALVDSDTGDKHRAEWDNEEGKLKWGIGIDPAEYTVDQLNEINEFAHSLIPDDN